MMLEGSQPRRQAIYVLWTHFLFQNSCNQMQSLMGAQVCEAERHCAQ